MSDPRDFFDSMVKLAYEDWLSDPLTEWKAKAAVANADMLAERVVVYWNARSDRGPIAGSATPKEYRSYLRGICADFGLVWDVHDGTKHFALNRKNREVTNAGQTGLGQMGYGEGKYGDGVFGGGEQIIIELDSGEKRALSGVMQTVVSMWEKLLAEMGL